MALFIYIPHFIFGISLNAFTCILMGKCSSPVHRNLDYNYGVAEQASERVSRRVRIANKCPKIEAT